MVRFDLLEFVFPRRAVNSVSSSQVFCVVASCGLVFLSVSFVVLYLMLPHVRAVFRSRAFAHVFCSAALSRNIGRVLQHCPQSSLTLSYQVERGARARRIRQSSALHGPGQHGSSEITGGGLG